MNKGEQLGELFKILSYDVRGLVEHKSKISEFILSLIFLFSLSLILYLKNFFKRNLNGLDLFEFLIVIA